MVLWHAFLVTLIAPWSRNLHTSMGRKRWGLRDNEDEAENEDEAVHVVSIRGGVLLIGIDRSSKWGVKSLSLKIMQYYSRIRESCLHCKFNTLAELQALKR